jgi:ATP-dependent Lon protease
MATSLISALTNTKTRKDVGMTGEITLRGRVMEIGGVKEKVIAAHRAGLKTIVMPRDNKKDLEDVPDYVKKDIKFVFVDHLDQVLDVALVKPVHRTGKSGIKPKSSYHPDAFLAAS